MLGLHDHPAGYRLISYLRQGQHKYEWDYKRGQAMPKPSGFMNRKAALVERRRSGKKT